MALERRGGAAPRATSGTSNRPRGALEALDSQIYATVVVEGWVLITNNAVQDREAPSALMISRIVLYENRDDSVGWEWLPDPPP